MAKREGFEPPVLRKGQLISRLFTLRDVGVEHEPCTLSSARARRRTERSPRPTLAEALRRWEDRHPAQVAAIQLAAVTGLRIGEILAIRWEHLDLDTGRLTLPATKTGRRT